MNQSTSCTASDKFGRFCDAPSADGMPFPICFKHAFRVWKTMDTATRGASFDQIYNAYIGPQRVVQAADRRIIYYIRVGEHIKIGRTANLRTRVSHYPPGSELLAVEPETRNVSEGSRQLQFKHLLNARKEWFRPGEDLMAHIEAVRAEHGLPAPGKRSGHWSIAK